MSSIDLPSTENTAGEPVFRSGFTPEFEGLRAECDGGHALAGTKYAGRQEFTGTLTGHYRDYGPYPWRWYLLGQLTRKPEGFVHDAVWCDSDSLTIVDGKGQTVT